MSLSDLITFVLGNLNRMRLRSALTMIGVIIGTSAIILMVSIGVGLQTFVTTQIEDVISATQLMIFPGAAGDQPGGGAPGLTTAPSEKRLDEKAIRDIEKMPGVKFVDPQLTLTGADIIYRKSKIQASSIQGLTKNTIDDLEILEGRAFKSTEKKVAIVGNKLNQVIFSEGSKKSIEGVDLLGKNLTIVLRRNTAEGQIEEKSVQIRVVGVLEASGAERDFGFYMPLKAMEEYIEYTLGVSNLSKTRGYDQLIVEADSIEQVSEVEKALIDKDYNAFAFKNFIAGLQTIFTVIQAILGGVGAIALMVAAIGIVNTMIMSIYERTREIGIMKAIGASNINILTIFLLEAGTIGILGGLGGIILSFVAKILVNFGLSVYLKSIGSTPVNAVIIPIWLIIFSVCFAFIVGVLAGLYPARRAARLSPLTALRYE